MTFVIASTPGDKKIVFASRDPSISLPHVSLSGCGPPDLECRPFGGKYRLLPTEQRVRRPTGVNLRGRSGSHSPHDRSCALGWKIGGQFTAVTKTD